MVMATSQARQVVMFERPRGRIVCMDSAYDVDARNQSRDVVVTGSYCGVLCARFIAAHRPRGVIGVDCAIGLDGAGVAGLWYYEALNLPAAAVNVMTVELGNGQDVLERGEVSRLNDPAARCGVRPHMTAREAAELMYRCGVDLGPVAPHAITHRTVLHEHNGRAIVCIDSIAFALPEDRSRNVLCTAGHTGRSAVPYLRAAHPRGFICSDGGIGRNGSGIVALTVVESDGLAGATVDARTARMGDGLSTYMDGVISAVNEPAFERGARIGMAAKDVAILLLGA